MPSTEPENTDTWSLSYAPTEANRRSSEQRRSTEKPELPRQLGSLAPPPYKPEQSPDRTAQSTGPGNFAIDEERPRVTSPRVSVVSDADGGHLTSRSISPTKRSTESQKDSPLPESSLAGVVDHRPSRSTSQLPDSDFVHDHAIVDAVGHRAVGQTPISSQAVASDSLSQSSNIRSSNNGANIVGVSLSSTADGARQLPQSSDICIPDAEDDPTEHVTTGHGELQNTDDGNELSKTNVGPSIFTVTPQHPSEQEGRSTPGTQRQMEKGLDTQSESVAEHSGLLLSNPERPSESEFNGPRVAEDETHPATSRKVSNGDESRSTKSRPFSFVATDTEEANSDVAAHEPDVNSTEGRKDQTEVAVTEESNDLSMSKRPPSFSRPFNQPHIRDHPAFRDPGIFEQRSQTYASEDPNVGVYGYPPRDSSDILRPNSSEDEPYRIPGPYGHYFKSRQQSQPAQSPNPGQWDHTPEHSWSYQPSPERAYVARSMGTEYTLPGMMAPALPEPTDRRRLSGIIPGRSKSRPRIPLDNSSDALDDPDFQDRPKRRSGLLRKIRHGSESSQSHQASAGATSSDSRDRLGHALGSPTVVESIVQDGKRKPKKLQRASTSDVMLPNESKGNKKGFSRLSGLFGRSSKASPSPVVQGAGSHPAALGSSSGHPGLARPDQYATPDTAKHRQPSLGRNPDGHGGASPISDYRQHPGASRQGGYDEPFRGRSHHSQEQTPSHQFSSQLTERGPVPQLRIDTSAGGNTTSSGQRLPFGAQTAPVRDPPHGTNRPAAHSTYGYAPTQGLKNDSAQHAINLHKRSRSPRLGRHNSDERLEDIVRDPANRLGTFKDENRLTSPKDDSADGQEAPWKIGLPQEEIRRRRSGFYNDHNEFGHDSGIHMGDNSTRNDHRTSAGNGFGDVEESKPQWPMKPDRSYYQRQPTESADDDMYNDSRSYHPPPSSRSPHPSIRSSVLSAQRREGDLHSPRSQTPSRHSSMNPSQLTSSAQKMQLQQQQQQQQRAVYELPGSPAPGHPDSDDEIIMSPTSYPGQEWIPNVDFGSHSDIGVKGWDD
ncbi:hypothetical protein UCRPC4_g04441 [Phaeomoniella chlamydospora]|uniref:Uncharacterized protein n=1 Tax=Phaeomoniella chlamydospora TaxID=158046 RepID=A0A0G2GSH5_PHACM|nr:hypothetical protein UCRPC4_g04441 [Phaeomoniella chlamydospora]